MLDEVTNLVENGVRHGEGHVSVRLADLPADHDFEGVRVEVSDEGPGIEESLRRRVLTKFWTTGSAGGSGLGLYLAHGLTRVHGGEMTIGDRPGGGAPSADERASALDRASRSRGARRV